MWDLGRDRDVPSTIICTAESNVGGAAFELRRVDAILLSFWAAARPCGGGVAMRVLVASLLLSAGVPLFCQSAGTLPAPDEYLPRKALGKSSPAWHMTPGESSKMMLPPGTGSLKAGSAQIDPGMVVHPPPASIGVQPPGTLVAQNLYPGLKLMPIEQPKPKGIPIPTTFANARMVEIPTTWPGYKAIAIGSGKADSASK